ncbi:MAG: hypothetical protein H8F28_21300 [Fibrella sp.]|nr:hypothetical protein [Armatimonadota bacterium]
MSVVPYPRLYPSVRIGGITVSTRLVPGFALLTTLLAVLPFPVQARQQAPSSVDALLYSTMPSSNAHRPEMVMDNDPNTYFRSAYGMSDGDDLTILLSQPIPIQSIRITTGNTEGDDLLTDGFVDASPDGVTFTKIASFGSDGVADVKLGDKKISVLRIRVNKDKSVSALLVREITIKSPVKIVHVALGPGRGFVDISQAPDLAGWSERAQKQMESFWTETAAMLYSENFITPNKINIVYRTGPGVTDVAACGGGVMTVNAKWCREHPEDTGLTVHEMAHAVQSMSAYNPVWLIEGIADYVRWVKFEPENHKPRINVQTAAYHDSYRTTATFLGWCELKYDNTLVTKLNRVIRAGKYDTKLFAKYTGKDVDTLWAEFIQDYKEDPDHILTPVLAPADRPRVLPSVKAGSSVPVPLSALFDTAGIYNDGLTFGEKDGFDAGGAAYSEKLLGKTLTVSDVEFRIEGDRAKDVLSCRGNVVALPTGNYKSLWLLGAAVEGNQMAQVFTVIYTDGSTEPIAQNVSDWYQPQRFPGEGRAAKMAYRNMMDGLQDPRPFYVYRYGFKLDPTKTVKSITLPDNQNVKLLGITLAN